MIVLLFIYAGIYEVLSVYIVIWPNIYTGLIRAYFFPLSLRTFSHSTLPLLYSPINGQSPEGDSSTKGKTSVFLYDATLPK